jgi:hypothetical protein
MILYNGDIPAIPEIIFHYERRSSTWLNNQKKWRKGRKKFQHDNNVLSVSLVFDIDKDFFYMTWKKTFFLFKRKDEKLVLFSLCLIFFYNSWRKVLETLGVSFSLRVESASQINEQLGRKKKKIKTKKKEKGVSLDSFLRPELLLLLPSRSIFYSGGSWEIFPEHTPILSLDFSSPPGRDVFFFYVHVVGVVVPLFPSDGGKRDSSSAVVVLVGNWMMDLVHIEIRLHSFYSYFDLFLSLRWCRANPLMTSI